MIAVEGGATGDAVSSVVGEAAAAGAVGAEDGVAPPVVAAAY